MTGWPSLSERKAAKAAAIVAGVGALRPRLAAYARAHGGRFLLYGSVVREGPRFNSDVDLLVDFPEAAEPDAWRFAEGACWDLGLTPDVRPLRLCGDRFLAKVTAGAGMTDPRWLEIEDDMASAAEHFRNAAELFVIRTF